MTETKFKQGQHVTLRAGYPEPGNPQQRATILTEDTENNGVYLVEIHPDDREPDDHDGIAEVPAEGILPSDALSAAAVFETIVDLMGADNGCRFRVTPDQHAKGEAACKILQAAGFFLDDPNDFQGSFWQAAAGEATEMMEFFASAPPESWSALSAVLDDIFSVG